MLRLRTAACLATAVLVAASITGCSREKEKPQPAVSQEVDRRLTVNITGARTAKFEGTARMKVITRKGQREQLPNSVAAIEPMTFVKVDDSLLLKLDIGVVGMYKGDGTYTIPAGVGPAPQTGPTVPFPAESATAVSVAGVTFIHPTPPASELRYGYVLEPCKVTLKEQATVGTAECPALVAVNGERITLKYRWSK